MAAAATALSSNELALTVYNVPDALDEVKTKELLQKMLGPRINIERCDLRSERSFLQTNVVDVALYASQAVDATFHRWIEATWCQSLSKRAELSDLWLDTNQRPVDTRYLECPKHKFKVNKISFGSFNDPGNFVSHWDSTDQAAELASATIVFEHDAQMLSIKWVGAENTVWIMETSLKNLDKFILVCPTSPSTFQMYLFLQTPLKLFSGTLSKQGKQNRIIQLIQQEDEVVIDHRTRSSFNLSREVQFGTCAKEIIGSSNVLSLELTDKASMYGGFMLKLQKHKFSILSSHPRVIRYDDATRVLSSPQFESFNTHYAWFCLMSRGFKITDQLSSDFLSLVLKVKDEKLLTEIFHSIASYAANHSICSLRTAFEKESLRLKTEIQSCEEDDGEDMPLHYASIRRIILTPTTIRGMREEWTGLNRVVRTFDPDRFIRVSIRDDDYQRLMASAGDIEHAVENITECLTEGLGIGDRHYKFLGASNSQLREHGLWMYASDGTCTTESIRRWMGDLSHERCVATYMARLGQFFSTSKDTIEVEIESIPDIERNDYIFTDGIGIISEPLARKISSTLKLKAVPSAFQIRLGGCKGVVAVFPDLRERKIVQIRPSMEKFKSDHKKLEVLQTTKPDRLYLNRQVIMLLEGLEVPKSAFFALQEAMLQRMANMLLFEDEAATAISKISMGLKCKEIQRNGVALTVEPFFRSILEVIYQQKLSELVRRTRIEIPPEKGRIMMGTVDETDTLKYGEVFIRYSSGVDASNSDQLITLDGPVVVAKNPCFHPGDLRKFRAVNCPSLNHMIDCIVFPSNGTRPHPNEMSGSDLDGDMYFVCWEKSLIPKGKNKQPMEYKAQPKNLVDEEIIESDMIQFIETYLQSDQLGIIANAHLVHADSKKDGIFSEQCLKLAQMHSHAVDFLKTGECPIMPPELRPQTYPHFMKKRDKPGYTSNSVIAKLFDQCLAIKKSNLTNEMQPTPFENDFELPGYKVYLNKALALKNAYCQQMFTLMETFGIESEAEILTAQILKIGKQGGPGLLQQNLQEAAEVVRIRVQLIKKNLLKRFFEEFGGANCECTLDVLRKASALYHVTYSNQTESNIKQRRQMLGLPWIFQDLLFAVKTEKLKEMNNQQIRCVKPTSLLNKLSMDIQSSQSWPNMSNTYQIPRLQTETLSRLEDILLENRIEAKLVMFGSAVTTMTSNLSLVDYAILNINGQAVNDAVFINVISALSTAFSQNSDKTPIIVPGTQRKAVFADLKMCLFRDLTYLQRTAYIVAAMLMNRWMIPAIRTIIAWANSKINYLMFGSQSDCLLTLEDLVLMFFTVVFEGPKCECVAQPEDTHVRAATALLKNNHFLSCSVDQCEHLLSRRSGLMPNELQTIVSETEISVAELVLNFFKYYSSNGNTHLKLRGSQSGLLWSLKGATLLSLKNEQCSQISDRMMQACHSLAHSKSIEEFLNPVQVEDEHLVRDLPRQVCTLIASNHEYHAERLLKRSGAHSLNIRVKTSQNSSTWLVLEAWGNSISIFIVEQLIQDLVKTAMMMTIDGDISSRIAAEDAYHVLMEDCQGPDALLCLQTYAGPYQPDHDKPNFTKHVPRLLVRDRNSGYDFSKFSTAFRRQMNFIRQTYSGSKSSYGDLAGIISYGTYYVVNGSRAELPLKESDFVACNNDHINKERFVSAEKRDHASTSSWSLPSNHRFSTSFIPDGKINLVKLKAFLESTGFLITEQVEEYRVKVDLQMASTGPATSINGVLVLNENFKFKCLQRPDTRWLVLDTVRGNLDGEEKSFPEALDMRFRINSRSFSPNENVLHQFRHEPILLNANQILTRTRSGNAIRVMKEYAKRVKFLRQKHVTTYAYCDKPQDDASIDSRFFNAIKIEINQGKQFSRNGKAGQCFTPIEEDRLELAVCTPIPDLGDQKLCNDFINWIWKFGRELGDNAV